MNDDQIIDLYWQRNDAAIRETSRKYGVYCFSIAENILKCREDSEECVNDTWLQTWNSIPPQRPNIFRMYLAKITRNLSFNRYQAQHAVKRGGGKISLVLDELSECVADTSDPADIYQKKELEQHINCFVRSLSERDGNIFIRRYFFTESVSEIAKHYHLTENNVMVILSRTRRKLRLWLKKEGYVL